MSFLYEAVLFLAAAVISVPLSKRLGLGTVLGFLLAGVIIGPWGLRLVSDVDTVLPISELGVVLLLFLIGLELQPRRLWALRRSVFGFGSAQLLVTALPLMLAALALGVPATTALVIGLVLSLSSTAFALQLLGESGQLGTRHGRSAFAILLFQDLAAIPLLAIVPALGGAIVGSDNLLAIGKAILVIGVTIFAGRLLLRPFLRLAAASRAQEILTAAGLLVVMGTALLVHQAGLSMALGAFLAGVLLADSEYRHELEADIEPFKGLLLGLFFMAVGMAMNLGVIRDHAPLVIALVIGFMAVKIAVLFLLARAAGQRPGAAVNLALYLSQGGEFAFVLFGTAVGAHVMDAALADLLVLVVSLSMAVTPLLLLLNERVLHIGQRAPKREFDQIDEQDNKVIIAGFGRFGQMIARTLRMKRIPFTALEASFEQVDFVRKFGNKIYFGDASRLDLLRSARAEHAKIFVLAIDDVDASVKTAEIVKRHYPNLKIYARARNRMHAYRLMDVGVDFVIRETFLSSLDLAKHVLHGLGLSLHDAGDAVETFRRHDEALLRRQHAIYQDEAQLIASSKQGAAELERLFEQDTGGQR